MSEGGNFEKQKGPEKGHFQMSSIKRTFEELHKFRYKQPFDTQAIQDGINALNLLIEEGQNLRGMGLRVMDYVDSALHQIYPEAGDLEIPEIRGLMEEEREILERIRDNKEVNEEELQQVTNFFHFMWDQLDYHETGKPPSITKKRPE